MSPEVLEFLWGFSARIPSGEPLLDPGESWLEVLQRACAAFGTNPVGSHELTGSLTAHFPGALSFFPDIGRRCD